MRKYLLNETYRTHLHPCIFIQGLHWSSSVRFIVQNKNSISLYCEKLLGFIHYLKQPDAAPVSLRHSFLKAHFLLLGLLIGGNLWSRTTATS